MRPDRSFGNDILTVDFTHQTSRSKTVTAVTESLRTGFVYVRHHLPPALLDDVYSLLNEFFKRDAASKEACTAPGARGAAGYTGPLVETAASSDVPDWKEMLNWMTPPPAGHPLRRRFPDAYAEPVFPDGLANVLTEFHGRVLTIQTLFLEAIAEGLGAAHDVFSGPLRHGPTLSRAIHYPAMAAAPAPGHVWAAEHADINLPTVLPQATAPGLQIMTDGGWVDAIVDDDVAILNTGLMLERVTNAQIPAGWHRVVAPEGFNDDRLSIVQFAHPAPSTVLAPLAGTVDPAHPQRWLPIQAGDMLDEVVFDINLVEDARRVS